MNKLSVIASMFLAFVLIGCTQLDLQSTINEKRNGIFLVINELKNPVSSEQSGAIGTGFLVGDNEILTNYHVVQGDGTLKVKTESSATYDVEIVKFDPIIDLALIKIKDWDRFVKENKIEVLTLGNSSAIKPLDEVFALGNPWGLTFSVSKGVVSHPVRRHEPTPKFLIQTDAKIYNGNSGGPLLNNRGEVIGMNSLMMVREGGSFGFALHSDVIKKTLDAWREGKEPLWPTIGVHLRDDNVVEEALKDLPADKAGVKKGDKILDIENQSGVSKTENILETIFGIAMTVSPNPVILVVERGSEIIKIEVQPIYKTSKELK